jgi:hypothetical protein
MICRIQVVVIADDGNQDIRESQSIERTDVTPETLGLTLAEGKALLKDIQQTSSSSKSPAAWRRVGRVPTAVRRGAARAITISHCGPSSAI